MEAREYFFTNDVNWINNKEKWTNLKLIGSVKKYSNKKLVEERYFISYIDSVYVKKLVKVIRSEWHIENNLHWYLDAIFKEDSNKSYINESQKKFKYNKKILFRNN